MTEETTRICPKCGQKRPISDFRRRRRDTDYRHSICRRCLNRFNREDRRKKRAEDFLAYARDAQKRNDLRRLVVLTEQMIRRCRGVDAFVEIWHDCLTSAQRAKKQHLVLRGLSLWSHMVSVVQNSKIPFEFLTEEERLQAVRREAQQIVVDHPEILLEVAHDLGWKLIPPRKVRIRRSAAEPDVSSE